MSPRSQPRDWVCNQGQAQQKPKALQALTNIVAQRTPVQLPAYLPPALSSTAARRTHIFMRASSTDLQKEQLAVRSLTIAENHGGGKADLC